MSGVGRLLRHLTARRRRWARDVRANMQIVEVMVVGLMVVGAVVAVSTMDVPVSRTEGFKETNESLVNDSLTSMARHPSDASDHALFGSILEEYVMEAVAGNAGPLMSYLNKTLPAGANYNVLLDNGYGPPRTLVDSGKPPREAVAGSIQFVPKLAYTFMISDFSKYQGDFQMNVHAVPISNGALLHDEGDTVELAVTFHDEDSPTDSVTVRTYGSTALRKNDPAARSWPSVSMYNDVAARNHFIDASGIAPTGVNVPLLGNLVSDDYNISFDMALVETAGVEVPKGTEIRFQFPRLWDLRNGQREYVESSLSRAEGGLGNGKFWTDFEYEGNSSVGLVVKAQLKDSFSGEKIWFNMTADYMALVDSANPLFGTISVTLGDGVQGMSNMLVKLPGTNLFGALRREPYLSLTKPLISGDTTTWGASLANKGQTGDNIVIEAIEIRQPQGKPVFKNLQEADSWSAGTWTEEGPGHWKFTPDPLDPNVRVTNGNAAWLSFDVEGGNTNDNNYRNQNYLNVTPLFNPENTTSGPSGIGEWEFTQRAFEMWEEWVHRVPIAPSDGDPLSGYVPGWPDETGYEYWVSGGTMYRNAKVPANFTYSVVPFAASSGYFGDYQGSHVFSDMSIVDATNTPTRDFALGEKVRIKNDFSAIFGELSVIDGLAPVSITDLRIDTYVYTPEKAWKGIPSATFSEDASVIAILQDIKYLADAYVADDDTHMLVAVDSGGLAYGIDSSDGTKYWIHDTARDASSVTVADLDGDGNDEVLIGHTAGMVTALDARTTPSLSSGRELWTRNVSNPDPIALPALPAIGGYDVMDMVQVASADATRPELVVTASADANDAWVRGLDVTFDGTSWSTSVHSSFQSTDQARSADMRMQDLEPVWIDAPKDGPATHVAVAADNLTVMLLDATDLSAVTWVSNLYERPYRLFAADLDGDGADDLVVNTYDDTIGGTSGKGVIPLSGRTGNWGANARPTGFPGTIDLVEAAATPDGGVFGVAGAEFVMQDHTALYNVGLAWPSTVDPLDLANVLMLDWNGLHVTPDGTVFIIEDGGDIRYATDKRLDGGYDWALLTPNTLSTGDFVDLHVPADWATGGRIHSFEATGKVHAMDDQETYTVMASVCDSHGVPHAGVTCGPATKIQRWYVGEDAQGDAAAVFALVNDGETTPATAGVYRYDVAAGTWSTVKTWADREVHDMDVAADGTYLVAGRDTSAGQAWLMRKAPAGAWTAQTLMNPTTDTLKSVLAASSGDAYAASDKGVVWRQSTTDTWTRVPIAEMPAARVTLVETADGGVWALGQNYAAAPLYTHQSSSWLYLPMMHDELPDGETVTKMEIEAIEGHLGSDPLSGTQEPVTEVIWWYKNAATPEWTKAPTNAQPSVPYVDATRHNVTISCPDIDSCEDVRLRAELRNRVVTDGSESMRRDGGATPLIRDVTVTFWNGLVRGTSESLTIGPTTGTAGTTAVYTDAHQGYVNPKDPHRAWTYVGDTNAVAPAIGGTRQVAVSSHDLIDGSDGTHIMVTESDDGVGLLLEGLTGGIARPATGTTSWVTDGSDITGRLLILDMDADGYDEVVGAGRYDGVDGAIRVWDVMEDRVATSAGEGWTAVLDLVSMGVSNGQHRVAYVTDEDVIRAVAGEAAGTPPSVLWSTDPSASQGKAAFIYPISESDMYGTGLIVSELVFRLTDNGNEVTQTARILDWFNITPPGENVPNPPIYTVEIVSWFNEA